MNTNKQRRSFLQGGALAGVAVAMPLSAGAALKAAADGLEKTEFPLPDFATLVGESVVVSNVDGLRLKATIEEVADINYASDPVQRPGYLRPNAKVVRFSLDDDVPCENTLYQVSHAKLGRMELLLAPVPDAKGKLGLEAIFN